MATVNGTLTGLPQFSSLFRPKGAKQARKWGGRRCSKRGFLVATQSGFRRDKPDGEPPHRSKCVDTDGQARGSFIPKAGGVQRAVSKNAKFTTANDGPGEQLGKLRIGIVSLDNSIARSRKKTEVLHPQLEQRISELAESKRMIVPVVRLSNHSSSKDGRIPSATNTVFDHRAKRSRKTLGCTIDQRISLVAELDSSKSSEPNPVADGDDPD